MVRNGASSAMRDCFWRLLNAWERAQEEKTCTEEAVQEKKLEEAGQRWLSKETDPGRACAKNTWQVTWIKRSLGMKFYMDDHGCIHSVHCVHFIHCVHYTHCTQWMLFIYLCIIPIHSCALSFVWFHSIAFHSITLHSIFSCALHTDLWRRRPAKPVLGPASHAPIPFHSIPFINVIHYHSFIPASITSHFIIISLAQSLHLIPSTFNDVCIQSTFL